MGNGYPHSTIAQILEDIIDQLSFEGESHSNIADILLSILNQTSYDKEPYSVLAELFLKLKAKIEGEPFDPYDKETHSVIADILISILNETEYTDMPQSRIAELLLELKEELESYTEITVSGSIVSFTTNVSKPLVKLKANVEAQQDLHGYDKPWAGGGGANLWGGDGMLQDFINANISDFSYDTTAKTLTYGAPQIASKTIKIFANAKENTAYTLILSAKNTANTTHTNLIVYYTDGTYAPLTAPTSLSTKQTFAYVTNASKTIERVRGGNYNGRTTIYYDECCVLEGVKTVSDFVPYENICPITGWSGANVTRTGKNLFVNTTPIVGRYLSDNGSQILYSGWNISDYIPIKGGETYHFKPNSTLGGSAYGFFYTDNSIDTTIQSSRFVSGEVTITAPSEARYVRFSYRDTSSDIQLELGSTATAYEPYNGNTYTISFGDTYYGCELVVIDGAVVLRVNRSYVKANSIPNWYKTGNKFYCNVAGDTPTSISYESNFECSFAKVVNKEWNTLNNGECVLRRGLVSTSLLSFVVANDNYSTVEDFKASLTDDFALTFPIYTPIEIPLTPIEIDALAGDNVIFADTGDVEVTYLYKGTPET